MKLFTKQKIQIVLCTNGTAWACFTFLVFPYVHMEHALMEQFNQKTKKNQTLSLTPHADGKSSEVLWCTNHL